MDFSQAGAYTYGYGNFAEGLVFYACMESLGEEKNPTILVLGGSVYLLADFLDADCRVIAVHSNQNVLDGTRSVLAKYFGGTAGKRLRTERRSIGGKAGGLNDLLAKASGIVCLGLLHHVAHPQRLLAELSETGLPLVVEDTTSALMQELIDEEAVHAHPHRQHLGCRNGCVALGLCGREDAEKLLSENCPRPLASFQYGLACCWCAEAQFCRHRGKQFWMATWGRVP